MCSPGMSALSACANSPSMAGDGASLEGHWQLLSLAPWHLLGLGLVFQGALDHGRAFALSCWAGICPDKQQCCVRGQVHPQATLFPVVLSAVCGAYPLNRAQAAHVLWCLLPTSPQLCAPGSSMQYNRGWGGAQDPTCLPSTFLGCRLWSNRHPAENDTGSNLVAFSALMLVSSSPTSPQLSSARAQCLSAGSAGWPAFCLCRCSAQPPHKPWDAAGGPVPRHCLAWPLPVPGSTGKSSAVKAKSRLLATGQLWLGTVGQWQLCSGLDWAQAACPAGCGAGICPWGCRQRGWPMPGLQSSCSRSTTWW